MKIYINPAAFDRCLGFYHSGPAKSAMSPILAVIPNNEKAATAGVILPPYVVMRRGENLEDWARRTRPNLPTALHALLQIATALHELHVMGYVYYAMKPSNVLFVLPEKQWVLSDFGCIGRKGGRLIAILLL
jgi:serine/threonine protein kinase